MPDPRTPVERTDAASPPPRRFRQALPSSPLPPVELIDAASSTSVAALRPRPFSVMVKPVGSHCNLRCDYCYYLPVPRSGPPRMTDDILERFLRQYIAASPGPEVGIVWHGGEPTLAGLDFFRHVIDVERALLPPGWTCRNNLQTNGILLDDDWCAFLAGHRFDVGLSLDGTAALHDAHRPDARGHGTYDAAAAAVRRLQAHGLQPDLLCTVNPDTAAEPLAVYRALRDLGTGWIQFIPIVRRDEAGRVTPDSVTAEAYGDFLCTVFDEWAWHDLGRCDVQLFAETGRVVLGGAAGLCWLAPTCGRALIVESDGGVYSCDHFVNPAHRLGDVLTGDLGDLAETDVQRRFGDAKRDGLAETCRVCPWLRFCHGGCPKDRDGDGLNHLCAGLARFFAHATPVLARIAQFTRAGQTPDRIMATLRTDARAAWQGVGRNDPCPCGSGRKAKACCWPRRP